MMILSKLGVLSGFICLASCFSGESNAAVTCNGADRVACEQISSQCVWANNTCTAPVNGGCYGKNEQQCGVTTQGSNARWCRWAAARKDDPKSCLTNPNSPQ